MRSDFALHMATERERLALEVGTGASAALTRYKRCSLPYPSALPLFIRELITGPSPDKNTGRRRSRSVTEVLVMDLIAMALVYFAAGLLGLVPLPFQAYFDSIR